MSRWRTVPKSFPDYDDLTYETQYALSEGYCVHEYESKKSGRYYKKIRFVYEQNKQDIDSSYKKLIQYLGYEDWWINYRESFSSFLMKKLKELFNVNEKE